MFLFGKAPPVLLTTQEKTYQAEKRARAESKQERLRKLREALALNKQQGDLLTELAEDTLVDPHEEPENDSQD